MNTINITLTPESTTPTRSNATDAGLDLYAAASYHIPAGTTALVDTGITVAIPEGHVGILAARSSLHKSHAGAHLANSIGVIDASYRGLIKAAITSTTNAVKITKGDKIVQLLILPIATPAINIVDELNTTARGTGGFGSTNTPEVAANE